MSQRHVFITKGISREAFVEAGVRMTGNDPDLEYHIHTHPYSPTDGGVQCCEHCSVVRNGVVIVNAMAVTLLDDAKGGRPA